MKIFYAETCDCSRRELWIESFEPTYFQTAEEHVAADRHLESIVLMERGGPRYFAYHVAGRHIINVIP
jgi:hypothetical protein